MLYGSNLHFSGNVVLQKLAELGIPMPSILYPYSCFNPFISKKFGYQRGDFPVTEHLGDVSLALPFSARNDRNTS